MQEQPRYNDPDLLTPEVIARVLDRYGLGPDSDVAAAGGTASPKVVFSAGGRRYMLRRRRSEFCPEPVVRFDHSVIRRLADAGLPVTPPLATRDGQTYVSIAGAAHEVFPFVEGLRVYDQESAGQTRDAGRQLGRLHRATQGFAPEGAKYWPREFHMAANRKTLADFLATPDAAGPLRPTAERLLAQCDRVAAALPDERVDGLPHCIIHGDYTWANVMFSGARVAGIFDFDWTDRHPRIHDAARGLIFFAGRRKKPLDGDTIWGLVTNWTPDAALAEAFLDGYAERVELSDDERRALPAMVAETWFCCRIRAMRKAPDDRKLELLAGDLDESLEFLARGPWPWGDG